MSGLGYVYDAAAIATTYPVACSFSVAFKPADKFTGKERDTESGNDYFFARYYGSSMGRFLSPDSFGGHLEDPQSLNRYSYVGNNPLVRTDPDGHDFYMPGAPLLALSRSGKAKLSTERACRTECGECGDIHDK